MQFCLTVITATVQSGTVFTRAIGSILIVSGLIEVHARTRFVLAMVCLQLHVHLCII